MLGYPRQSGWFSGCRPRHSQKAQGRAQRLPAQGAVSARRTYAKGPGWHTGEAWALSKMRTRSEADAVDPRLRGAPPKVLSGSNIAGLRRFLRVRSARLATPQEQVDRSSSSRSSSASRLPEIHHVFALSPQSLATAPSSRRMLNRDHREDHTFPSVQGSSAVAFAYDPVTLLIRVYHAAHRQVCPSNDHLAPPPRSGTGPVVAQHPGSPRPTRSCP